MVRDGPIRSDNAPPTNEVEERTTCNAAHNSGTTATAMPNRCARRIMSVSGIRIR